MSDYCNWFHIIQDDCELKIKHVMNMHLKVTREIPLTKVERLWNGPSLRGVKPVLVCFQLFKDKEEVLRKSNMLLKVDLCNARRSADVRLESDQMSTSLPRPVLSHFDRSAAWLKLKRCY